MISRECRLTIVSGSGIRKWQDVCKSRLAFSHLSLLFSLLAVALLVGVDLRDAVHDVHFGRQMPFQFASSPILVNQLIDFRLLQF